VNDHLDRWLVGHTAELVALRRFIHAHPDLSGQEHRTAAVLANRLEEHGLEPVMMSEGNGFWCDIGTGDGPVVALRADLDALPVPDAKHVPYRSTVDGACHACGHDVHATVVLGAGLALHAAGDLPGRVRLVFQPSEEVFPSGAPEMIKAGALDGVASAYAVHCDPKILAGQVGLRVGPITAAGDRIEVRLFGPGGHTARPHNTVDLVYALGILVSEVPSILNRRVDPRAGLSLVFAAVHAGVAPNAIPESGFALGTVRALDRDAWETAPDLITQLVHEVVAPTGATAEVHYTRGVPPVVNDSVATAVLANACLESLGQESVVDTPQSMGAEDFACYLEHVPGSMARLGVGRPGEQLDLHQGTFDVDESAIGAGVRMLATAAWLAMRS
jgi:amidohydrolase